MNHLISGGFTISRKGICVCLGSNHVVYDGTPLDSLQLSGIRYLK